MVIPPDADPEGSSCRNGPCTAPGSIPLETGQMNLAQCSTRTGMRLDPVDGTFRRRKGPRREHAARMEGESMMSRRISVWGTIPCLVAVVLVAGCRSTASDKKSMVGLHYPVGISYVSGFEDVVELYEDHLRTEADTTIPIGLTFDPYYQFESGLAVGAGVGPVMLASGDVDMVNVPINVSGRYYFDPEGSFSPYLRAGLSYNIASGDFVEGSTLGVFGGAGVEFFRTNPVSWGLEVVFDTSTVEFERAFSTGTRDIKPIALKIGMFIIF